MRIEKISSQKATTMIDTMMEEQIHNSVQLWSDIPDLVFFDGLFFYHVRVSSIDEFCLFDEFVVDWIENHAKNVSFEMYYKASVL